GKQRMAAVLDSLRADPPATLAGMAVTHFEDLRDPEGRMGPLRGATDAAGRNVLVFRLGDAGSVVLRPSGTEPKAKAYIEACSSPRRPGMSATDWSTTCRAIDAFTQRLADEFLTVALGRLGQKPTS